MVTINVFNIFIVVLSALVFSDVLYILYKKVKQKPTGIILFAILSPTLGALLSLTVSDTGSIFELFKNMILFAIIILLIPINILCIKNGFVMTGKSAKNTFKEAKNLFKEQKDQYEKSKKNKDKNTENNKKENP